MDRYGIAIGKKPKKISVKKVKIKKIPKKFKQSYFVDVEEMLSFMNEVGGTWISEERFIFEEESLIGYKNDNNEIVIIKVDDYEQTKRSISEIIRNKIDQEKVINFSN